MKVYQVDIVHRGDRQRHYVLTNGPALVAGQLAVDERKKWAREQCEEFEVSLINSIEIYLTCRYPIHDPYGERRDEDQPDLRG